MDDFNAAFSEYLKALGNSELTVEKIDELKNAISALSSSEKGCTIEIESKQFKNLVKSVRDYTERLSKANSAKSSNVVFKLFEKKPNDTPASRNVWPRSERYSLEQHRRGAA